MKRESVFEYFYKCICKIISLLISAIPGFESKNGGGGKVYESFAKNIKLNPRETNPDTKPVEHISPEKLQDIYPAGRLEEL